MPELTSFGILADDLTGACDCGVQFSARGARVRVLTIHDPAPPYPAPPYPGPLDNRGDWDVTVLNTESRHCDPQEASRRVADGVVCLARVGWPVRYLKIDSTLRGNPVAEVAPLLGEPGATVLVAPAFPPAGRTVEGGTLLVNGIPVHETEIGRDRLTPVLESHLPTLFADGLREPVGQIALPEIAAGAAELAERLAAHRRDGRRVVVADARSDGDLDVLAAALMQAWEGTSGPIVVVGSAGMARAMAARMIPDARPAPTPPEIGAAGGERGPVLIVAGSRQEVTRRQVDYVGSRRDAFHYPVDPAPCDDAAWARRERVWLAEGVETLERAAAGGASLLQVSIALDDAGGEDPARFQARSARLNRALGSLVVELAARLRLAGLVLTGGDIALAALGALEAQALELGGEVLAGLPLSWTVGGRRPGLPVVTKAGGFGAADALWVAARVIAEGRGVAAE
ncbi:MAG: four-carbon acid sugar kinase family protein [bacterium]